MFENIVNMQMFEIVGECMKLNPTYKPPAGYKPVYKEAKLFIPVRKLKICVEFGFNYLFKKISKNILFEYQDFHWIFTFIIKKIMCK